MSSSDVETPAQFDHEEPISKFDILDEINADQAQRAAEQAADLTERKRQAMLGKNVRHIARRALRGDTDFPSDYFMLSRNRPQTPGDWRNIQEQLAQQGIEIEYDRLEDDPSRVALSDDYSHDIVRVNGIPRKHEPRHSKK